MNDGDGEGLRQLLELVGPGGELPKVADVDPYRLGIRLSSYSANASVPYIVREIDSALDNALANEFFICVTGASAAGKSRTAFEAAKRNLSEANLLVPIPKPGVLSQRESPTHDRVFVMRAIAP